MASLLEKLMLASGPLCLVFEGPGGYYVYTQHLPGVFPFGGGGTSSA